MKLFFAAACLATFGWMFAAPAPIQRGPLKQGTPPPAAPQPATQKPVAQKPAVQKPLTQKPAVQKPAVQKPLTQKPAIQKPAVQKPAASKPAPPKSAPAKKPLQPKVTAPVRKPQPAKPQPAKPVPATATYSPRAPYRGAIAVDADTGRVLFADNMRTPGYPASVTKLMTFLLVLEDIQAGFYGFNSRASASPLATSMEPSSVGLRPGQSMTIHDLLLSIMVKSANDAAEVLAEHSALAHRRRRGMPVEGVTADELCAEFVERMNRRARELGMRDTRYASPNGLPPSRGSKRGFDVSTAADLVELGKVIVRMPKALSYTSCPSCTVTDGSGKPLTLVSHNYFIPKNQDPKHLCTPLPECDGLKTGFTAASGSSIMLTAHRNGRRVIVVVLGSAGRHERETAAGHILRDSLDAISIW